MSSKVVPIKQNSVAGEKKRRSDIVDEFGQLSAEIAASKPKESRIKALKEEIQRWAEAYPACEAVMFEGRRYAVQVGAKGNKRKIRDMVRLFVLLGQEKFLNLCNVTLKACDEALNGSQLSEVIEEEKNVGERTVKPMQRAGHLEAA